jgi:predicted Zn-dependent peptidase
MSVLSAPFSFPIEQFRLDNGLRVVVSIERSAPVVAVAVYYDVGSRDEVEGRTGFAHLFEHMMFEGSENVGKFEHIRTVQRVGGVVNGTTSTDRTNYYEAVPSHYLDLVLWLEADRMRSLQVTAENFENQRQTVKEERRQTYDNQPYAKAFLRLNELAYRNFGYAHSTIGEMADLDAAPLEAVQEFFRTYYAPNNAVLSIAGDVDFDDVRARVAERFGSIPARPAPARPNLDEPPQTAEKVERMTDPLAALPAFLVAWHIPPARSPDAYALELLSTALGDGKSSRLNRRLVDRERLAQRVSFERDERRGPDLMGAWVVCQPGREPAAVRDALYDEIDSVARDGIEERELQKAKNRVRARFIFGLQSAMQRAQRLAEYAMYFGDAELLRHELARYDPVRGEDVRRVAAAYLTRENRTCLEIVPGGAA